MDIGDAEVVAAAIAAAAAIVVAAINMNRGSRLERDIKQYRILKSERQEFQEGELKDLKASIVLRIGPDNRKRRLQSTALTLLLFGAVLLISSSICKPFSPADNYSSQVLIVFTFSFFLVASVVMAIGAFADIRDIIQLRFLNSDKSEKSKSSIDGPSESKPKNFCCSSIAKYFPRIIWSIACIAIGIGATLIVQKFMA